MPLDIHPHCRHLVHVGPKNACLYPLPIIGETDIEWITDKGHYNKVTRVMREDPTATFDGPFTAEGDME